MGEQLLISFENVSFGFGAEQIFENINITIENNDRIALIGPNGAGKTTLLNLISQRLECDSGIIAVAPNMQIGYLRQNDGLRLSGTIQTEMDAVFVRVWEIEAEMLALGKEMAAMSAHQGDAYQALSERYSRLENEFAALDGYACKVKIDTVLNGMGFGGFDRDTPIATLSGGERTRLMLCRLLASEPELLILDEATNHLDFLMLAWLEDYLAGYRGAILTVSHDRWFLDRVTQKTWEVEGTAVVCYPKSYSGYVELRKMRLEQLEKDYDRHVQEVQRLAEYAERNIARASTAQSAKSRLKAIDRMGEATPLPKYQKPPKFSFRPRMRPVSDVLEIDKLSVCVGNGADKRCLIGDFSFLVKRGDKVAIVGENGAGKSTLLKTVAGQLTAEKGSIEWGKNTQPGYYDQDGSGLVLTKTALDTLWDRFPASDERSLRTLLGTVGLTGEEAFKLVGDLSGGERARLKLAMLTLEEPNVLLMDEPTNHLDIPAKEALEQALCAYEGTVVVVSHDRWLLSKVPNKIIRLADQTVEVFCDGFEAMQNTLNQRALLKRQEKPQKEKSENGGKEYRTRAQRSAEVQQKRQLEQLEKDICLLEEEQTQINQKLCDPEVAQDFEQLTALTLRLDEIDLTLLTMYEQWDKFSLGDFK